MKVPVDPQKRFLIHVTRILRRPEEVHGQSEHTLVVGTHQLLKSVLVTRLGRPDQRIDLGTHAGAHRSSRICHNSRYIYAFRKLPCCSVDIDAHVVDLSRSSVRFWDGADFGGECVFAYTTREIALRARYCGIAE